MPDAAPGPASPGPLALALAARRRNRGLNAAGTECDSDNRHSSCLHRRDYCLFEGLFGSIPATLLSGARRHAFRGRARIRLSERWPGPGWATPRPYGRRPVLRDKQAIAACDITRLRRFPIFRPSFPVIALFSLARSGCRLTPAGSFKSKKFRRARAGGSPMELRPRPLIFGRVIGRALSLGNGPRHSNTFGRRDCPDS